MTCFMVPHTNHGSILGDGHVKASIFNITHAVNDSDSRHEIERKNLMVEAMLGAGARDKVNYHRVTPVSAHLPRLLSLAVQLVRQVFDARDTGEFVLGDAPQAPFNEKVLTRPERENLLGSGYKHYTKKPGLLFEASKLPKPEDKALAHKSKSSFSSFK